MGVRGRPRNLTPRDKRALARLVANNGIKTAVEATRTINLEREDQVSSSAVRLTLKKTGSKDSQTGEETKASEGV